MLLFPFFIIVLYFLIAVLIAQMFNPNAELVINIGIATRKTKAETEIHPESAEPKIKMFSI